MFDVYVRGKGQFLVIRHGAPLPLGLERGWKRKRAARAVSDDISGEVMREGFYKRSPTLQPWRLTAPLPHLCRAALIAYFASVSRGARPRVLATFSR